MCVEDDDECNLEKTSLINCKGHPNHKLGVAFSYLERKKQTSNTIIAQAYHRDTAPESYQVRPESLETFKPSYASSKVKNENEDS